MKKLRNCLSAVLAVVLAFSCVPFGVFSVIPWDLSEWNMTGWQQSTESGVTVVTADSGLESAGMVYNGSLEGFNSIEADIRYNVSKWEEGHSGFYFTTKDGSTWYVDYRSDANAVRIRCNSAYMVSAKLSFTPKANDWMHWQVMWSDTTLYLKVEDTIALKYDYSSKGDTFEGDLSFKFWQWGQPMSVKNVSMSTVTPDAWGHIDLEFKDDFSVSMFQTEGATAIYEDGQMKVNITAGGATLTSPAIAVPAGDKYSAFLPVRNTLCVRLKNDTDADKLTVYFVSDRNPNYSQVCSKTFDIEPNSGYKTYFFNLSDVIYMGAAGESYKYVEDVIDDCEGYLHGFRFELPDTVTSGSLAIDAITFEREDPIYEYAGEITSCVADGETELITVTGKVDPSNAGKTVIVYESAVNNYNEGMTYPIHNEFSTTIVDIEKMAEATVGADGTFTTTLPLYNGDVSRLSSLFLAWIDGVKVSGHFAVENYTDFYDVGERVSIPTDLVVKVTDAPFNAKGDAFTDDTKAIQAAIDYVAAQGGGVVILPGDTSTPYGRRYVATNINLKSNIELRIEEGAMVWQSQREEEYDYSSNPFLDEPVYGHDNDREGVVWAHAINDNLPLINVAGEYDYENQEFGEPIRNVRITGGGTVRLVDTGGEQPDPHNYAWNSNITVGCASRIHIAAIAFWNADGVDVTDMTIQRSNSWHMHTNSCNNVYFANNTLEQATCINSDGFGMGNAKNSLIFRNFVYGNDDGVTLSTLHEDKRGHVHWHVDYDRDNTTENISIVSNQIWNGLGIAFVPWGTGGSDLSKNSIRDILIYDNVLGGESCAIGSWPDNPMYGWSSYYTYDLDNGETDDWSPVSDISIINNRLRKPYNLRGVQVTNLIIENTTYEGEPIGYYKSRAATSFIFGNFDRVVRSTVESNGFKDESDWVVGLANWSRSTGENGSVGTAIVREDLKYSGYIKGDGELYQGLYLRTGAYELKLKAKAVSGNAKIFVADKDGFILYSSDIAISEDFENITLTFDITANGIYRLGVSHTGDAADVVYLDDASVKRQGNAILEEDASLSEDPTYPFTDVNELKDFAVYSSSDNTFAVEGGKLQATGDAGELKALIKDTDRKYSMVSVDIYPDENGSLNAGLYFSAQSAGAAQDNADALCIMVESDFEGWKDAANRVDIVFGEFSGWTEIDRVITETGNGNNLFTDGEKVPLRLTVEIQEKLLVVTLSVIGNPERYVQTYFEYTGEKDLTTGMVGLRANHSKVAFDNMSILYTETEGEEDPDNKPGVQPNQSTKDIYTFSDQSELADFGLYSSASGQWKVEDGKLVPGNTTGENKAILKANDRNYSKVSVDIIPGSNINMALYLGASGTTNAQDQINALAVIVESNFEGWEDAANRVDIVVGQFPTWKELSRTISETGNNNALFTGGNKEPLHLEVEINGNELTITLSLVSDPNTCVKTVYQYTGTGSLSGGQVGIRCQASDCSFDNFAVEYTKGTANGGIAGGNPNTGDSFGLRLSASLMSLATACGAWFVSRKKKFLGK